MPSPNKYPDSSPGETNRIVQRASAAFALYRNSSPEQRARLMKAIAAGLRKESESLIQTAARETHLSPARLKTELERTIFQLKSYGDYCAGDQWPNAHIDTPTPEQPNKRDIRKTLVPLGPVVVFGASNFPFAYSTAGGDTASALAAGCTVIVKAHPAHPETGECVSNIILQAVQECGLPEGVFSHIYGASFAVSEYLVKHPLVKAVGFTGSFSGGKHLFDLANQRKEPIPVFAEMGSTNPVFILPERLEKEYGKLAEEIFSSISLSMGQFCTKPGLIIGIESDGFSRFVHQLSEQMKNFQAGPMLHEGILNNYNKNKSAVLSDSKVTELATSKNEISAGAGIPALAQINAQDFINNPDLHREVFGPFSLVITCRNKMEMQQLAENLEGQLTATVIGSTAELKENAELLDSLKMIAGRIIVNGVPTGVEVCLSMHHGGPFPASTDSRFTAVGGDAIRRFARPVAFQNWPDELLPDELKNGNPLKILRTVNGILTREAVSQG